VKITDAGNTVRSVTSLRIVDVGGVVRNIRRIRVLDADGTTWRTVAYFAEPLSLTIAPNPASGIAESSTITSPTLTAVVQGGFGPYSYAWTVTAHSSPTPPTPSSNTLATITATQTGVPEGVVATATLSCTVTDSGGFTASATVPCTFFHQNF
jgi:hypothetical protein